MLTVCRYSSVKNRTKRRARRASQLFCSTVCMIDQYCVSAFYITSTFSIHKICLVIDQSIGSVSRYLVVGRLTISIFRIRKKNKPGWPIRRAGNKGSATHVETVESVSYQWTHLLSLWIPSHSPPCPGCCGLFCEPCLVYQNAEGLNKSGVLYCLLGCISPCIPALLLRNEARDQYNIEVSRYTEYLNCL